MNWKSIKKGFAFPHLRHNITWWKPYWMLFKDIKIQIFRFRKSLSQSDLRDLFFGSAIKINFFLIDFVFLCGQLLLRNCKLLWYKIIFSLPSFPFGKWYCKQVRTLLTVRIILALSCLNWKCNNNSSLKKNKCTCIRQKSTGVKRITYIQDFMQSREISTKPKSGT